MIHSLYGYIGNDGPDDGSLIEEMSYSQKPQEIMIRGRLRLALFYDTHRDASQCYEDEDILVVFSGEFFNQHELSKGRADDITDAMLLRDLYYRLGDSFASELSGFYSIIIYEKKKEIFSYYCDKNGGMKQCYYTSHREGLFFSSNIKALLGIRGFKRVLDESALYECLRIGWPCSPKTMFLGIKRLLPGECLKVTRENIAVKRYWTLRIREARQKIDKAFMDRYYDAVEHAVMDRIREKDHARIGASLSGGVDSSVVVSLMSRHMHKGFNIFSLEIEGTANNDLRYAMRLSEELGTKSNIVKLDPGCIQDIPQIVWNNESVCADLSVFSFYRLAQAAGKKIDIILGGDGNDTVYGHYNHRIDDYAMKDGRYQRSGFIRRAIGGNDAVHDIPKLYLDIYSKMPKESLAHAFRQDSRRHEAQLNSYMRKMHHKADNKYNEFTAMDIMLFGSQGINTTIGKMVCDATTLAAREPLADKDVQSIVNSLPLEYKNRKTFFGWNQKYLFKKAIADRLLPRSIVYRKKEAPIIPLDNWFDSSDIKDALIARLRKDDIIKADTLAGMLERKSSGINRNNLIMFALMYPAFKEMFLAEELRMPRKGLSGYLSL